MTMVRWQFVCENNFGSQAISWFSSGHFSHVDYVLDDGRLLGARSDMVRGISPGVRVRPPGYLKFSRRVVLALPCHTLQKQTIESFLIGQIGKPYDREAILAFLFNRNWRMPDSWICSELQAAGGEKAAIVKKLLLATNKITPVAWALVLSAVGAVIEHSSSKHTATGRAVR